MIRELSWSMSYQACGKTSDNANLIIPIVPVDLRSQSQQFPRNEFGSYFHIQHCVKVPLHNTLPFLQMTNEHDSHTEQAKGGGEKWCENGEQRVRFLSFHELYCLCFAKSNMVFHLPLNVYRKWHHKFSLNPFSPIFGEKKVWGS